MSTDSLRDGLDALAAFADVIEEQVAAAMDTDAAVDNIYYGADDDVVYVDVRLPAYEVDFTTGLGETTVESDVELTLVFDDESQEVGASINEVEPR